MGIFDLLSTKIMTIKFWLFDAPDYKDSFIIFSNWILSWMGKVESKVELTLSVANKNQVVEKSSRHCHLQVINILIRTSPVEIPDNAFPSTTSHKVTHLYICKQPPSLSIKFIKLNPFTEICGLCQYFEFSGRIKKNEPEFERIK